MSKDGETSPLVIDDPVAPAEMPNGAWPPAAAEPPSAPVVDIVASPVDGPVGPSPDLLPAADPSSDISATPSTDSSPKEAEGPQFPIAGENAAETPAAPQPPAPASRVHPSLAITFSMPPLLEYAGWRLLEWLATVAVAAGLLSVLLPSSAPADLALLADRLGVTLPLLALCLVVAGVIGAPMGFLAGLLGGPVDTIVRALSAVGTAVLPIWLAMLLVLVFAATLGWLQPGGFVPWAQNAWGAMLSLLLPALALGLPMALEFARALRNGVHNALVDPWLETARTMGWTRREAVIRFVPRQALGDALGEMFVPLSLLVPACVIVENVFYLPGLGRLLLSALSAGDAANLQSALVTLVALVGLCRFIGQVLRGLADPRLAGDA